MISVSLYDKNWSFRPADKEEWLSAEVPGCVHTDLIRHELIPDPFWGDNELGLRWIEEKDWVYRCEFAAPPENVKTVDVQIGSWPTFRDIPVER